MVCHRKTFYIADNVRHFLTSTSSLRLTLIQILYADEDVPDEDERELLCRPKYKACAAREHIAYLMSLPIGERIAQVAEDKAKYKADKGAWTDIEACKSADFDSEFDSESDSASASEFEGSTEHGTALYHFLLDAPAVLREILSHLDLHDLICFSLTSKECARRAEYLIPAKTGRWTYGGQDRASVIIFLQKTMKYFGGLTFCPRCEVYSDHDEDNGYLCITCVEEDDEDLR